MRIIRYLTIFSLLTAIPACGGVEDDGDDDDDDDMSVPASASIVVNEFIEGSVIVVSLGAPLSETGNDFDQNGSQEEQRGDVEGGLGGGDGDQPAMLSPSGGPVVSTSPGAVFTELTNPDCISFAWSGLTVTVHYAQCTTEEGQVINGSFSLGIELIPLRFFVGMDQLQVDAVTYDGEVGLSFTGAQGNRSTTLDVDFAYDDGEDTSYDIDELTLDVQESGSIGLDGAGVIGTPGLTATFDATSVVWTECINPSSGELFYDDGTVQATVTFLSTTPADGIVTIQIGAFQTNAALLPPCML